MKTNIIIIAIFFVWYWLLVEIGNMSLNPDDTMWSVTGGESKQWMVLYYLCPIASFIIAEFISRVIRAIRNAKSFPWRSIIVFILVFWGLDHSALFTNFYYWHFSFDGNLSFSFIGLVAFLLENLFSFHEFTAPAAAIIVTALIFRRRLQEQIII